jgi:microcystin-dependent protein
MEGATGGDPGPGKINATALQVNGVALSPSIGTAQLDNDAVTYAKLQNISATARVLGRKTAGAGDAEELTLSEVLEFVGSAAQGDLLYRGASSWTRLGAGSNGQYLQTQGAGANPQWATASGAPTGSGALWFTTTAPTGWLICDGAAVSRATYAALFAVMGTGYGAGDGSTTFNLPDFRGRFALGAGGAAGAQVASISALNTSTERLTVTGHPFYAGQKIRYAVSGGSAIGGLTNSTDYYAVPFDANTVRLATSVANALAGTVINLSGSLSGSHTLTYNLTSRSLGAKGGEEEHVLSVNEMPAHSHDPIGSGEGGSSSGMDFNSGWFSSAPGASAGGSAPHNIMPPFMVVNFIVKT